MAKVMLSACAPSGDLTLGNYIGALRNWVKLQDEYDCYFPVADLHTITVRQDPKIFRSKILDFFAQYIAAGITPERSNIFIQSHVAAHSQLSWLLQCYTYVGELSRMTQFKAKSELHADNINSGLFGYPVLMIADILLYNTDIVPIGADQKQHMEIARIVAERFNKLYGDTFVVPGYYIPKVGARIMSLQDPTKKMSKSDPNMKNKILLIEEDTDIVKKIKSAVTDSIGTIKYDEERAGITNLISILSACGGLSFEQIERIYDGAGYGAFKRDVADAVVSTISPIREKYKQIRGDEAYLLKIAKESAEKAAVAANATLKRCAEKIGFIV